MNVKKRISYLDVAKGISIILVIISYMNINNIVRDIIFSFHIPLFLFISGMMYKKNIKFKDFLIKIFKNLFIPYFLSLLVVAIIKNLFLNSSVNFFTQIFYSSSNYLSFFKNVESVDVLWFIPYLIVIRVIFYVLNLLAKNNDILVFVICLLLMFVGLLLQQFHIFLPWSLDIAFSTLFIYCIGYNFYTHRLIDKLLKNYYLIVLIFVVWIFILLKYEFELAIRTYNLIALIGSLCGSILALMLSIIIDKKISIIARLFEFYGRYSFLMLICHFIDNQLISSNNICELFLPIIFVPIIIVITNKIKVVIINLKKVKIINEI